MMDIHQYKQDVPDGMFEKIRRRYLWRRYMPFVAGVIVVTGVVSAIVMGGKEQEMIAAVEDSVVAQTIDTSSINGKSVAEKVVEKKNNKVVSADIVVISEEIDQERYVESGEVSDSFEVSAVAKIEHIEEAKEDNILVNEVSNTNDDPIVNHQEQDSLDNVQQKSSSGANVITQKKNIFRLPNIIIPAADDEDLRYLSMTTDSIIEIFSIRIFNRRGQQVYESKDPKFRWDATYKGAMLPQGAYVWVISCRDSSNRPYNEKGTVTVVR